MKREELEQEKTPLGWIPEQGQTYFYVDKRGDIYTDSNSDVEFELDMFKHTRVFKTEEEAGFEVERMRVLRTLEKFACDFDLHGGSYFIFYDYSLNRLFVDDTVVKRRELYFESREKAIEAIDSVGEDRVKKYYLEVKEK